MLPTCAGMIQIQRKAINSAFSHPLIGARGIFQPVKKVSHPHPKFIPEKSQKISDKEYNLPWSGSVNPSRTMTYMPLLQTQLKKMEKLGFEQISLQQKFICRKSDVKPARIGSICFRNEKFRKVRMTYFDAGDNVQVFNTLWYPNFKYDMPLFGVDLISLGKNRVLSVIDFQPLQPNKAYSEKYIDQLTEIRDKYPDLQGKLSGKIYDDTQFFSKNMLFGRFTDEAKIGPVVEPAFNDYLEKYLELMDNAKPNEDLESQKIVKARQAQYDQYSAEKDPAVGLFDAYFGKEWSHSYVHDFLFSLSSKEK